MSDLKLYETGDGGDVKLLGKDLESIEGFGNMVYIGLFGGNPGAITPLKRLPAVQDFSWWGNSILMPNNPSQQFNSLTEHLLNSVALNSSGKVQIEQAIIKDLDFMKEFATVTAIVDIVSVDRIRITIRLQEPDNIQATEFIYIWDGTRRDLIDKKISPAIEVIPPYRRAANALIAAAVYTDPGVCQAIINFFFKIYTQVLYNKLNVVYLDTTDLSGSPTFTQMFNQMKYNAVNPLNTDAAFRMTAVNTPSLSKTGIVFNGTTNWIRTHCIPSLEPISTLNNLTLGILVNDVNTTDFVVESGVIDGLGNGEVICVRYTSGSNVIYSNDAGLLFSETGISPKTFLVNNRTTSNEVRQFRNGVLTQTKTLNTTALPNKEIYRGGYNNADIDMLGGSPRSQCHYFRANFTDAQMQAYLTIAMEYQEEIELALGLAAGSRKIY